MYLNTGHGLLIFLPVWVLDLDKNLKGQSNINPREGYVLFVDLLNWTVMQRLTPSSIEAVLNSPSQENLI